MEWKFDDGGREHYFRGWTGDCLTRAVSIATGMDYKEVYDLVNKFCKEEHKSKRRLSKSSARTGVYRETAMKIMDSLGWEYISYRKYGHMLHLNEQELPMGTIICCLAQHITCVKDHVIYDNYNPSDKSNNFFYNNNTKKKIVNHKDRCVYGYWIKKSTK